MDQLLRLKDTVVGYLTPKRRRTLGPNTPHRMEQHSYEPASEPQSRKSYAALRGRINAKLPSPSDTRFGPSSRKRAREGESDTTASRSYHTDSEISPDESASQITPIEESEGGSNTDPATEEDEDLEEEIVEDLEEETQVSPEDKVAEYLVRQAELALRKDAIADVKAKGDWHPEEVFLFERLSMRSFEQLFPAEWKADFPTLSGLLFTPASEDTFINYNCGSSASGFKALQRIFNLGWRVKDKSDLRIPTENFISYEIQKYIRWSEVDGGYHKKRFIPVLTVVAARPKEAIVSISQKITDQMDFLAEKHRESLILPNPRLNELGEADLYLRHPPLLYGIIVAQTKAIFVTLDSSISQAKLRHIAHVDFKEEGHAVWNGLAVALVAVVARNHMMTIKDELENDDEGIDDDPDA